MATSYGRLRMFWGAFDVTLVHNDAPQYATAQIHDGGTSAAVGSGIGVRRASLVIDRSAAHAASDPAFCHFDFLNVTGGTPDDTWTTGDFTTMEGHLDTWWATVKTYVPVNYKLTEYRWHRVGTGVPSPNPAERTNILTSPAGGSASGFPPQAACSITFRTGIRKSWGRTYLPVGAEALGTGYVFTHTAVDAIAGATDTLVTSAAGDDFALVVMSAAQTSALAVESVSVDDVPDVIRRRRWKVETYRKVLP